MELSVFVLMPFNKDSEDRYELAIKASCEHLNLECSRVDEQIYQESILDRIFAQISGADIIVADMTGANPNVFFETGYAKALGKKIIFLTNNSSDIPFDLKHYPHIIYSDRLVILKKQLITTLNFYINEIKLRNFKTDTDNIAGGISDTKKWIVEKVGGTIESIFVKTDIYANQDLVNRIENANNHFVAFGLTRNFYISDVMYELIKQKALKIPIKLFLMNPDCESRKDRYRLEPMEAALEDSLKYKQNIESKYRRLIEEINNHPEKLPHAGFSVYYFNFPCSFAIEKIDDFCRIMLYGHNKRGTDSPIFVFRPNNPFNEYFSSQIRWLEDIGASSQPPEPWKSKNIAIEKLE